jgi:hypothetical protein
VAEHAHLLGSSGIAIIRELFAADAAAAATGGAAADSIAAAAGSELPSPHKLDSKVGGWLSVQAGWLVGLRLRVRRAA